jgi:hypothetical protein
VLFNLPLSKNRHRGKKLIGKLVQNTNFACVYWEKGDDFTAEKRKKAIDLGTKEEI